MKYWFNFTIEEHRLEQIIKNVKKLIDENHLPDPSFDFQKLDDIARCAYFLIFAIIGLFRNGFNEEEVLKTLETLFGIIINKEDLSPGNDEIH